MKSGHGSFVKGTFSIPTLDSRLGQAAEVCSLCGSIDATLCVNLLRMGWTVQQASHDSEVFYLYAPGYTSELVSLIHAIDKTTRQGLEQMPGSTPLPNVERMPVPIPKVHLCHFTDEQIESLHEVLALRSHRVRQFFDDTPEEAIGDDAPGNE